MAQRSMINDYMRQYEGRVFMKTRKNVLTDILINLRDSYEISSRITCEISYEINVKNWINN